MSKIARLEEKRHKPWSSGVNAVWTRAKNGIRPLASAPVTTEQPPLGNSPLTDAALNSIDTLTGIVAQSVAQKATVEYINQKTKALQAQYQQVMDDLVASLRKPNPYQQILSNGGYINNPLSSHAPMPPEFVGGIEEINWPHYYSDYNAIRIMSALDYNKLKAYSDKEGYLFPNTSGAWIKIADLNTVLDNEEFSTKVITWIGS